MIVGTNGRHPRIAERTVGSDDLHGDTEASTEPKSPTVAAFWAAARAVQELAGTAQDVSDDFAFRASQYGDHVHGIAGYRAEAELALDGRQELAALLGHCAAALERVASDDVPAMQAIERALSPAHTRPTES